MKFLCHKGNLFFFVDFFSHFFLNFENDVFKQSLESPFKAIEFYANRLKQCRRFQGFSTLLAVAVSLNRVISIILIRSRLDSIEKSINNNKFPNTHIITRDKIAEIILYHKLVLLEH